MRIKRSISKHSVSYSVIENVRDINGKSTTKVVEALGNEEEIRAKHPGVDPEEWARAYAKKLTEQKKKMAKEEKNRKKGNKNKEKARNTARKKKSNKSGAQKKSTESKETSVKITKWKKA